MNKRTFSLSQKSRAKLVSGMPWRENASLKGTFSLSQKSRAKLVSTMPWRENASLKGRFSLSQKSRAKPASAMPWRENDCTYTFFCFLVWNGLKIICQRQNNPLYLQPQTKKSAHNGSYYKIVLIFAARVPSGIVQQ